MERTLSQNERLHGLIGRLGLDKEEKAELVKAFTNGRSCSSKDLTYAEADLLIKYLDNQAVEGIKRMRSKIINIARDIGLTKPHPPAPSPVREGGCRSGGLSPAREGVSEEVDWGRLNNFLTKKFKKKLHELTRDELPKAVTAMEKWRESNLKKELGL